MMTRSRTIFALFIAIGFVMFAGSALAQGAPNPSAEAQWNRYLEKHPGAEANPNYLASHPGAAKWLQQHPDVASYARQRDEIGGRNGNNQRHNPNDRHYNDGHYNDPEWVKNHPNPVNENHPPYRVAGSAVTGHGHVGTAPVEHVHPNYNNGYQNNAHPNRDDN
jgi:hypothetical protein